MWRRCVRPSITQIHKYVVDDQPHFANSTDPRIPAALSPVVAGFASLNNFRPRRFSKVLGQFQYNLKTGLAQSQWTIGNPASPAWQNYYVLSPADFGIEGTDRTGNIRPNDMPHLRLLPAKILIAPYPLIAGQ